MSSRMFVATAVATVCLGVAACHALPHKDTGNLSPSTAAGSDEDRPQPAPQVASEPKSFFADPRARQPGDVLTVLITENASVAQTARTQADKSQSLAASLNLSPTNVRQKQGEIDSHLDGGGSIERTGQMLGKLAVRVVRVDAYGNLAIAGEQEILINNERQKMRLQGFVRPADIDTDNTIPSWRVTGAKIELTGRGFLSRKQSPGWIAQLLAYFGI